MASTTLGKRTRSAREAAAATDATASLDFLDTLSSPAKRTRRSARTVPVADKIKVLPSALLADGVEDQENREPWDGSSPEEAQSPPNSLSRRTSTATTKSSTIPVTPSTPRHYDVFAKGATTPRHRVMSVGKLSRRMTPQTPSTPASSQTVYHQARQLFSRSADPGQLVGRDEERSKLRAFLDRCTTSHPGGCLYVSGPPGTGKSAMVNAVTNKLVAESSSIRKAYINCMSIKSSRDLYATLVEQLTNESELEEDDWVTALQRMMVPKRKSQGVFLVVLDEIDHILTLDPESLYRVFEWSLLPTSRLALIGIANALDLTDRFLPRLKSRNLKPELLPVLPYTALQIKQIITSRLRSLLPAGSADPNYVPFFHPAAIELCSRKVSTQTGDLRRAFEVCRRALDLVESETRIKYENEAKEQLLQMSPSRRVLGEKHNCASPNATPRASQQHQPLSLSAALAKSLQTLTVETAPRVSIAHLNKVTAAAFSNGTTQRLKMLNLQQKAALCALLAIERRNRERVSTAAPTTPSSRSTITAPTIKTLYEAYAILCKRDSVLHPLSSSEFREVVGSLETLSLVTPVDGKTGSFISSGPGTTPGSGRGRGRKKDVFFGGAGSAADEKRVASCVGERDMEGAVEGMGSGILRSILSGEALDW